MLKRGSPKPLYRQMVEILREKIKLKEWLPNQAIPSENDLSKSYGVSRVTTRAVLAQLANEGLLYRVQGVGTFVSEPKITHTPISYMGVREQLERMGLSSSTRLLEASRTECPPQVAEKMHIPAGAEVFLIRRLRYAEDIPFSLHVSYIPAAFCADLDRKDLVGKQLCVILNEEYGFLRRTVVETLEAHPAARQEARALDVKTGSPLLVLEDVIQDAAGTVFEYTKIFFRGDKVKFKFLFESNSDGNGDAFPSPTVITPKEKKR